MIEALKRARNATADWAARRALASPDAERALGVATRMAAKTPLTYSFARRAMTTLTDGLREARRGVRRLHVGSVSMQIDVTDDVLREAYFAGIPVEPETTRWTLAHERDPARPPPFTCDL